jgi:hypothetical protein
VAVKVFQSVYNEWSKHLQDAFDRLPVSLVLIGWVGALLGFMAYLQGASGSGGRVN